VGATVGRGVGVAVSFTGVDVAGARLGVAVRVGVGESGAIVVILSAFTVAVGGAAVEDATVGGFGMGGAGVGGTGVAVGSGVHVGVTVGMTAATVDLGGRVAVGVGEGVGVNVGGRANATAMSMGSRGVSMMM